MASNVCLVLMADSPNHIKPYRRFSVGKNSDYFDKVRNKNYTKELAKKSILPINNMLLDLFEDEGVQTKISIAPTTNFLNNAKEFEPNVIRSLQELHNKNMLKIISNIDRYHNNRLHNKQDLINKIKQNKELVKKTLGVDTKDLLLDENHINDEIAHNVDELGYGRLFTTPRGNLPSYLFSFNKKDVITNHNELSNKINKDFVKNNMTAKDFITWIKEHKDETLNLFLEYDAFGKKNNKETGIFEFLEHLLKLMEKEDIKTLHPEEISKHHNIKVEQFSPEKENQQSDFLEEEELYNKIISKITELKERITQSSDQKLKNDFEEVISNKNLIHLLEKRVHNNNIQKTGAYETPYDTYIVYNNILKDIEQRLSA